MEGVFLRQKKFRSNNTQLFIPSSPNVCSCIRNSFKVQKNLTQIHSTFAIFVPIYMESIFQSSQKALLLSYPIFLKNVPI